MRTVFPFALTRRATLLCLMAASLSAARPAAPSTPWFTPLNWNDLGSASRSTDPFLKLMAEEFAGPAPQQATFVMGCFWHGEAELGLVDGVIGTVPGNVGSREVVKVAFNPAAVSYDQLLAQAQAAHVADDVLSLVDNSFHTGTTCTAEATLRPDEDGPKFYLRQSPLRAVPMTAAQACRVNGALLHQQSAMQFLSPAQQGMARRIQADPGADWPSVIGVPIDQAWAGADR